MSDDRNPEAGPAEGDLRSVLRAAMEPIETAEEAEENQPVDETAEAEGETPEGEAPKEVDEEAGEDTEGAEEAAPEETPEDEAEPAPEPEESPEPPQHWSAEDREMYQKAPPEMRDWALRREKQITADYTRKTQEISDFRKEYEPVDRIFEPYKTELRAQGLTPARVIEKWAGADQFLREKPAQAIRWLAQQYNVDLGEAFEAPAEQDPNILKVNQELASLRQQVTAREQREQQERQNSVVAQIESFANAKAESGDLLHPYFDEVQDDIAALAAAEVQSGRAPNLEDLYERAVWANPATRRKVISADEQKKEAARRAKARKAKNAAASVEGAPGKVTDTPPSDLRGQLTHNAKKAGYL